LTAPRAADTFAAAAAVREQLVDKRLVGETAGPAGPPR
jgi:hypothetical protein